MKGNFFKSSEDDTAGQLGIAFEPETDDEQLLLDYFVRDSHALGYRFWFHGLEQNGLGRVLRTGLTRVRGSLMKLDPALDQPSPATDVIKAPQGALRCGWNNELTTQRCVLASGHCGDHTVLFSDFTSLRDKHASQHPGFAAFTRALLGRALGGEALDDAWTWFKAGWNERV